MNNQSMQNLFRELLEKGVISSDLASFFARELSSFYNGLCDAEAHQDPEAKWQFVRRQFNFVDQGDLPGSMTPINAANLCPSWNLVAQSINRFRLDLNENVAIQYRVNYLSEVIDQARKSISHSLGVDETEIALVRNATEGNNFVNAGMHLKNLDQILLWDQNHPTNKTAWYVRQEALAKDGIHIHIDEVTTIEPTSTEEEIVAAFVNKLTPRTRVVTFSETSNGNGIRIPAQKIIEAVKQRDPNIHAHVDGTMSWGSQSLDLREMRCDSFVSSSHKWFLGPKETGILYMRGTLPGTFTPSVVGYNGKIVAPSSPSDIGNTAFERFELLGQRDDPNLLALLVTEYLNSTVGYASIQNRVAQLGQITVQLLKKEVERGRIEMVSPEPGPLAHGIVIFNIVKRREEDENLGTKLFDFLYEKRIGTAGSQSAIHPITKESETTGLRLTPHIFNLPAHLERASDKITQWLDDYHGT